MKARVHRRNVIMGVVVIAALLMAGVWLYKKPSAVVMKIDNYAITEEHLALYENEFRAEVTSYFYREYQLNPNKEDFWETEAGGEKPREVLREKAMNSLVYDTVERIIASRNGISADITLKDIMASHEQENRLRQSSSAVSYGPGQYGLMEYISRTQMEVRDQLKEKLLAEILSPTEEQLQAVYDNADPSLFDKGHKARVGIYMFYGMTAGVYPEELKPVWEYIQAGLAQGMPPADIMAGVRELSEAGIEYEEVEYDTAELPRDNQEMAWLAEQTWEMTAGDVSKVLDYGASQGILTVLDKSDYGTAGVEESAMLLRNLWLEEAYPGYIRQCMDSYGYPAAK